MREKEGEREGQGEVTLKRHARLDEHAGRKSHCKAQQCNRKPGGTRWECLSRVSTPISRFIGRTICAVLFNFRFPIAVAPWLDLSPMLVRRPRLLNFWLRENSARDNASRNWVQSSALDPGSSVLKGECHDPDVSDSFRWKVSVNGRIYARSTLYPLLDELFGEREREREESSILSSMARSSYSKVKLGI